jgi:hypothetical protein
MNLLKKSVDFMRFYDPARTLPFIRVPLNVLGVSKSDEVTVRFEDGEITITKRRG